MRLARSADGPQVDAAPVHLVSRGAVDRAAEGEVPEGCSADDPRANLVLQLTGDADERTWVGRRLQVGEAVLDVVRTPKHCLGVYAEVRTPGRVAEGDPSCCSTEPGGRPAAGHYPDGRPAVRAGDRPTPEEPCVSTPPSPTPAAPIRVPAGTTARAGAQGRRGAAQGPRRRRRRPRRWPPATSRTSPGPRTPTPRSSRSPAASADGRAVIRHSAAHVLAQAVQELFPGTRLGIGPPIENGFYYDFDPERPFTPEDLQALEKKMPRSSGPGSTSPAARSATTTPRPSSRTSRTSSS